MRKVTIMIPTYNQSQYIEQCVESAMAQDYPNLEIVISDDSTNNETENIIKQKYIQDPRIRYFHNEIRLGRVGNYHHTLYEKATGDYVLNLDGDDWLIDSGYISEAVKVLDDEDDVVCVIAKITSDIEDEKLAKNDGIYNDIVTVFTGLDYLLQFTLEKVHFNHMTALYRKTEALDVGFYIKEHTFTDSHSIFRLICDKDIAVIDKYVGVWRIHNENESAKYLENLTGKKLFENVEELRKYFLEKTEGSKSKISNISKNWKCKLSYRFTLDLIKKKDVKRLVDFYWFLFLDNKSVFFHNLINVLRLLIKTVINRMKKIFFKWKD